MRGNSWSVIACAALLVAARCLSPGFSQAETARATRAASDIYLRAGGNYGVHPLAGRVVGPAGILVAVGKTGRSGGIETVRKAIAQSGSKALILLGEVHDNAVDHKLRAALLPMTAVFHRSGSGRQAQTVVPAAVFEHIRADQKPALEKFADFNAHARRLGTAEDLFRFLEWDKSGWPDKKLFQPLYEAVIRAKLPIHAGDPPREMIKKVAKEGEAALAEEERKRLGLDTPLPAVSQEGLLDDLEKSHCGLMPKKAFGNLAYAQRYRDASLADAVLKAAKDNGSAILFAGNGHVRADRGVPWYIRQRDPKKKIVTVMLIEVEDGKEKPEDYDLKGDDGKPIADFVVFTPRAERKDPCEDMRKMFENKKGG